MSVENFVNRFPDVLIECPMPGVSQEQMTVAEFAKLEIGQKYLGGLAAGHATLIETGMSDETALTIVGGAAIVRDEQEQIVGLPVVEAQEIVESKKK